MEKTRSRSKKKSLPHSLCFFFLRRRAKGSFVVFNSAFSAWTTLPWSLKRLLVQAGAVAMFCVYPWKFQEWKLCFLISLHNMDANYYLSSTCEYVQWPASNIIPFSPRPHTTFVWFQLLSFSVRLLLAGSSSKRVCFARREAVFVPSPQEFLANVSLLTCK